MIKIIKIIFIFLFLFFGIFFANSFVLATYDFEVTKITTSPSTPVFNQNCSITATIKSINPEILTDDSGVGSYQYNFEDFEVSEVVLPSITPTNSIEQGDTFKYVFKGIFNNKGEKNLNFSINQNRVWPETRLTNNYKRVKVNVIPAYDLLVSSINITPANPSPNQNTKISIGIKNNGKLDLITKTGVDSFLANFDDFTIWHLTIPEISLSNKFNKGSTIKLEFEGVFVSSGNKNLNFLIDYDDSLDESNESNNEKSTTINVIPFDELDISVDSILIKNEGDGIIKGEDIEIVVTIKNTGNVSLTSSDGINRRDFKYNFDDFSENSIVYGDYPTRDKPLEPGKTFTYTFKGQYYPPGQKDVNYAIDVYDKLKESDELNNNLSNTFYIYLSQSEIDQFDLLDVSYDFISSTSAKVKWSTSKETKGELKYRRSVDNIFSIYRLTPRIEAWPKSNTMSKNHSINLDNLRPGDKYVFEIRAYRNNIEEHSDLIYFTTPKDDSIRLEGSVEESIDSGAGFANLTWNTNIISSSHVYYKKTGDDKYKSSGSNTLVSWHDVKLENLDQAIYEYYIESKISANFYKSEIGYFSLVAENSNQEINEIIENNSDRGDGSEQGNYEINMPVSNAEMYSRLKGKIILKVESSGEAYYINPSSQTMHYLGRPDDAFSVMREQGIGITNSNLEKIPVGLSNLTGPDADADGLPDLFEDAIGTDKNNKDTDGDGFNDKAELNISYNPNGLGSLSTDSSFSNTHKGKIFLQVERNGEAWYINPNDGKRYFLGRPADAFQVMRNFGLGISNNDFDSMK